MTRHIHPTERRTAEVVPFPLATVHWPADARARGALPAEAGVLIWREARSALFWVQTDDAGRITEVWPFRYGAAMHQVLAEAQHRPVYCYHEPASPVALPPEPTKQRRRRGAA